MQSSTFGRIVAVQLQGYTFQDEWPQLRSGKCIFCIVKYDAIITWTFALNMHVITRMYHKYIHSPSFRTGCAERIVRAPSGGHPQKRVGASLDMLCALGCLSGLSSICDLWRETKLCVKVSS